MEAVLILGDEEAAPAPPTKLSPSSMLRVRAVTGSLLTLEEAPSSLLFKSCSVGTEVLGLVQDHCMGTGCQSCGTGTPGVIVGNQVFLRAGEC